MEGEQSDVSYLALLEKFETTKKELCVAEDTIKRITGRDPNVFANGQPQLVKWKNLGQNAARSFPGRKRPLFPIGKAKEDEVEVDPPQEEESPDEEESPSKKPTLSSTVVATPKDVKSRKDSIREQNINSKVKSRNRRMLGMILGTLQKFQHEAKERKEQDLKKAEIEEKVEAAAAEEKERLKKEKEDLFLTRKEKQIQLRCLEKKIEIAEVHETWENTHKFTANFIRTNAEPAIYFLPAKHTPESEKRLAESKVKALEMLQQQIKKKEKELSEVEEWYKKDNFPSDKENIGPLDENEVQEPQEVAEVLPVVEGENATIDTNEDRTNENNIETLPDQEFEPIYD